MIDRRTVTIPRSWAFSVVFGIFIAVGALTMIGIAADRAVDRLNGLAKEVTDVAADAKAAAETNTAILNATRPCVADDPATPTEHPSCVREARSAEVVDSALRDIAEEAHAQHQHLVNVVAKLVGKRAPTLPRTAPRPATRTPATAPQAGPPPSPQPAAPSTTAAPALVRPVPVPVTTTTTCPTKGKKEKCR